MTNAAPMTTCILNRYSTMALRLSSLRRSANFTPNPPWKSRTTRATIVPIARTVPIAGIMSAEIAAPDADTSSITHFMLVPSANNILVRDFSWRKRG